MINPMKKYLAVAIATIVLTAPMPSIATNPPSNGSGIPLNSGTPPTSAGNGILNDIQQQISGTITGDKTSGTNTTTNPTANMDSAAQEQAKACAAGEKGTLGEQMKTALGLHLEMAAIKPNVEQLFENTSSCFSGLTEVLDLSFAIPSLDMFTQAIAAAVQKYAEQKVCSAAEKATSMITGPINEGLGKVNGMLDLNGQLNDLVAGGLSSIDPELGAAYSPAPAGGNCTVHLGGLFTGDAVTFEPGTGQNNVGSSSSQNATNTITGLNSSLSSAQSSLYPAQNELAQAQNRLRSCQAQSGAITGDTGGCGAAQQAVNNAQNNVNQIQANIRSLQDQIARASGNNSVNSEILSGGLTINGNGQGTNTAANTPKSAPQTNSPVAPNTNQQPNSQQGSGGFMQSIQDLISGK